MQIKEPMGAVFLQTIMEVNSVYTQWIFTKLKSSMESYCLLENRST